LMTAALELAGVSSGYGEALVLRDLDLVVEPGEIFALLGKNGMGKTTLLKTVLGFLRAKTGSVKLFGEDVTALPTYLIARKAIAYTPQEQTLFQDLTVEENLRLGLRHDRRLTEAIARVSEAEGRYAKRRRTEDADRLPRAARVAAPDAD
jgi:ABC-type branched-subunit amino acid transport system ATPase component